MDLEEIMLEVVDWNCLVQTEYEQQVVANMVVRHWVPQRGGSNKDSAVWC
jgi:hypothetical protein